MSLSPECYDEKTGNMDGRALNQQRRLICGLFIWSTLLTLGLATCICFQFFNVASLDSGEHGSLSMSTFPTPSPVMARGSTTPSSDLTPKLIIFDPDWSTNGENLKWRTNSPDLITGGEQLTFKEDGLYFLYLHVTLESPHSGNVTVTVSVKRKGVILSSKISKTKLSTGLMGKGLTINKDDTLTVTCKPKAQIQSNSTQTYLGVIKIG